jgi:hypothetical protein
VSVLSDVIPDAAESGDPGSIVNRRGQSAAPVFHGSRLSPGSRPVSAGMTVELAVLA